MKKILLALSFAVFSLFSFGQNNFELIPSDDKILNDVINKKPVIKNMKSSSCTDTVTYLYNKAGSQTFYGAINLNKANSAKGAGQYFPARQEVKVHGFNFYGYYSDHAVDVEIKVHDVKLDSLPLGAPIYRDTVTVPASSNSGFASTRRFVVFDSSVTINNGRGYILAVSMINSDTLNMLTSDYNAGEGNKEWLSVLEFQGSGWRHSYNVNVGGIPYDADFFIEPFLSYSVVAEISTDTNCVANNGDSIRVFNTSPLMGSHIYNMERYNNLYSRAHYDFGDGTGLVNPYSGDTVHSYATAGDYTISLTDTMVNWNGNMCSATDSHKVISDAPTADFTYSSSGQSVTFTPVVSKADSWYWDFGDGDTSHAASPTHYYSTPSTYIAKIYATNDCGTRIASKAITVQSNSIAEHGNIGNVLLFPVPVKSKLNIQTHNLGKNTKLEIFNILGESIYERAELPLKSSIKTDSWPEGTYIVKVSDEGNTIVKKISIVR